MILKHQIMKNHFLAGSVKTSEAIEDQILVKYGNSEDKIIS